MTKNQATTPEKTKPDVAGALQKIRAKKSPEQIKTERFLPFIPAITEALSNGWSWSSILTLIRDHGGPSLTKREAEDLYEKCKLQSLPSEETGEPSQGMSVDKSAGALQFDAKEKEIK
jgi:hypothetical protein